MKVVSRRQCSVQTEQMAPTLPPATYPQGRGQLFAAIAPQKVPLPKLFLTASILLPISLPTRARIELLTHPVTGLRGVIREAQG